MPKKKCQKKEFFNANQLEVRPKRPKGQIKFRRPTNLRQGRIYEIWPEKASLSSPGGVSTAKSR